MTDPTYSLAWPRELFAWEAERILDLDVGNLSNMVEGLLREAFEDHDVSLAFSNEAGATAVAELWMTGEESPSAESIIRNWLRELLSDSSRLESYEPPVYFAQRHGLLPKEDAVQKRPLDGRFLTLIYELEDLGYFPKVLPQECVDREPNDPEEVTRLIRRATGLSVDWPMQPKDGALWLTEPQLFSLIEFFHDQAQRPRSSHRHDYSGCGYHYSDFNRESGGVVYRWRMNEMLEEQGSEYRLAREGTQRGRLVRSISGPVDSILDRDVLERQESNPKDEIALAIEHFRERGASDFAKRAAVNVLANHLEPRRLAIKDRLTKKDEGYLFDVANNFAIRHRNDHQRDDYGPEFIDWLFVNYIAMIQLVDSLERRP